MDRRTAAARIGLAIDRFCAGADPMFLRSPTSTDPEDRTVPADLQVGAVDAEGWVSWQLQPSRITDGMLAAIEEELGVALPEHLAGYLLARAHLLDQLRSEHHRQLVLLPETPTRAPLRAFHDLVSAWRPLTLAGYVPFGEWGDGWGPMCIDVERRLHTVEDGPVVWIDHEVLGSLEPKEAARREVLVSHTKPLYDSFSSFLADVLHAPDLVADTRG